MRLWKSDDENENSGDRASPRQFLTMVILATAATGVVALGLKFLIERVILVGFLKYPKGEVEELFKHLPLIAVLAGLVFFDVLLFTLGLRQFHKKAVT